MAMTCSDSKPVIVSAPLHPPPPSTRISDEREREILRLTLAGELGAKRIAQRVGVHHQTVINVWRRRGINRQRILARNALVEQHRDLAAQIARSVAGTIPFHMRTDLASVAEMALVKAADSYDPGRGVVFGAYAQQRIYGACIDSIKGPRYRENSAAELTAESASRIRDTAAGPDASVIQASEQREGRQRIARAIEILPARLAVIAWLHHMEGQTLEVIAPKLGIVPSRVSQLHTEALKLMRESMGGKR
jgi:RNA polymerase sigma factor (sigma-70 family)